MPNDGTPTDDSNAYDENQTEPTIRDLLYSAGLEYTFISARLNVSSGTALSWATGRRYDDRVQAWLANIVESIEAVGLPEGWEQ